MEEQEKTKKPAAKTAKAKAIAVEPKVATTATAKGRKSAVAAPKTSAAKEPKALPAAEKPTPKLQAKKAAEEPKTVAATEKPTPKPRSKKVAEPATTVTAKPATQAVSAAAPKAKAKKAEPAEAPAEAKPVKKKAATAVVATAAAEEKKPSRKKTADTPASAESKVASKKAAKPLAEALKAAPPASAKKAGTKAKSAVKVVVVAPEAAAPAEVAKKERLKPRRRELKRQGLWVPKHLRGRQEITETAEISNPTISAKEAPKPSPDQKGTIERGKGPSKVEQGPKKGAKGGAFADFYIDPKKSTGKLSSKDEKAAYKKDKAGDKPSKGAKGGKSAPGQEKKEVPKAFAGVTKRPNTRTERKNERRAERMDKAEQEYNQSQGLFTEPIRLNRFVALSGICSRRDADGLIQEGKVKVNGKVVKEMGHKVMPGKDKIVYKDHELRIKVFVYLLMNKPKNLISTTDDERGRDTVMDIAERYTKARVYPVGRLDRNTTGLLLLTNDGDLTLKLTHPSSKFPKIYNARLDKDIQDQDLQSLRKGFELEDGFIKADKVERTSMELGNEIALEIHSGANHIVKRMLAHLGYEVIALDRVKLGPLNKRGLARGACRLLTEKEVGFLKML